MDMFAAEYLHGIHAHMRRVWRCGNDGELSKNEALVGWKARVVSGPSPGCQFCTDDGYASGRGCVIARQRSRKENTTHDDCADQFREEALSVSRG